MRRQTEGTFTRCTCLDFVEAVHRRRVYPQMYCRMELSGRLDVARLKRAVAQSAQIVPEVLWSYCASRGGFINLGHTAEDVVIPDAAEWTPLLRPDLSRDPQLRILLTPDRESVAVVMSHILTDGAGFLQYLYLLASLYNGERADGCLRNVRELAPPLANTRARAATEQSRRTRGSAVPPLRPAGNGTRPRTVTSQIPAEAMTRVRQRAKSCGATLNDVFLTAYARVLARLQGLHRVALPCPADLRRFAPRSESLTVANMTGIYRSVVIEVNPGHCFTATLQQVHIEMELQKSRRRCFAGIPALHWAFHRVPRPLLAQAVRAFSRPPAVSYTNLGTICHEKLRFRGCTVRACFLTGTHRRPPDFQLSVSTFQNSCTLSGALLESGDDGERGQFVLEQVKREILRWAEGE